MRRVPTPRCEHLWNREHRISNASYQEPNEPTSQFPTDENEHQLIVPQERALGCLERQVVLYCFMRLVLCMVSFADAGTLPTVPVGHLVDAGFPSQVEAGSPYEVVAQRKG